ncbi:MAG: hypothetical protein ACLUHE_07190 [Christensenellales bacterium]
MPPCWFPATRDCTSLLEMLKRKIGGEYLRVHPGVSALQLFAARLGVSWQDAKILSAHGRALSESALCATPCGRIGRRFAFSTRCTILRGCGRA